MAHAIVEWTDNLKKDEFDILSLLELIASEFRREKDVFPMGGIRVRGICLSDYVVADGKADDAFINISVLMGPGRGDEFKTAFFSEMFEKVKTHLKPLFDKRYLALSMYVDEATQAGSFKANNIHNRLKKDA